MNLVGSFPWKRSSSNDSNPVTTSFSLIALANFNKNIWDTAPVTVRASSIVTFSLPKEILPVRQEGGQVDQVSQVGILDLLEQQGDPNLFTWITYLLDLPHTNLTCL